MVISNHKMSLPLWIGSGGVVSIGAFLSGFGGKCFVRDLYIPRCRPDGDVVVRSGHVLKPLIRDSWLSGCELLLVGETLDFRCFNRSLVYSSIGSSLIAAVPFRICWANLLVQVSLMSVRSSSWVKMVPSAWEKCFWCCASTCVSISFGS